MLLLLTAFISFIWVILIELLFYNIYYKIDSLSETTFYEFDLPLNRILIALGMVDAFDEFNADLSGMVDMDAGGENLFVSSVLHKAFVKVDEEGTEAAAATIGMVGATSAPLEIVEFRIDRPFVFIIYDRQTNTILFIGRVVNPAE